jgi:ketosteroid isomerase-like protein
MKAKAATVTIALGISLVGGMAAAPGRMTLTVAQEKPQKPSKNKKDSKMKAEPVDPSAQGMPPGNDNELVDYRIAEMLAGWQLGDIDLLHSVYADDVSVVSGSYEPPIVGWTNFLATYQKLRARVTAVQKERKNTYTVVHGNTAWSSFQWEFHGQVDGAPANWRGQTTLVLEKRAGKWMIVHEHTSVVADASAPAAAKP